MKLLLALTLLVSLQCSASTIVGANSNDSIYHRWGIEVGFGGGDAESDGPDEQDFWLEDDQSNVFYANGEYYVSKHLAVTGGLHYTQLGMLTDFADGIGMKKINMFGLQGGIKYYFFPIKWVVQPHIGALVRTNILNLGRNTGSEYVDVEEGYPGSRALFTYDVKMPGVSLVPRLGVDIRLFSTVSLCVDYEMQWLMWGHDRYNVRMISGPTTGQTSESKISRLHTIWNVGVKFDFPMNKISSSKFWNTLGDVLYSVIRSKKGLLP